MLQKKIKNLSCQLQPRTLSQQNDLLAASSRASFAASATFGEQSHFAANCNRQITRYLFFYNISA